MIVIQAVVRAKPGKGDECAAVFAEMCPVRRAEPGNLAWVALRSSADPDEFRFLEVYRDNDALAEHLRLTAGDDFKARLAPLVEGPPTPSFGSLVAASWKEDELAAALAGTPA